MQSDDLRRSAMTMEQSRETPQSRAALQRANVVRTEGGRIHREVKAGRVSVAQALEMETLANYSVERILGWPKWAGPARARLILRVAGITGIRTVAQCTERQIKVIGEAAELPTTTIRQRSRDGYW
jgi:hypothetical protein